MIEVAALEVVVVATGRPVLRDVSVTVPRGVRLGVVGESGSGKSTLLRAITGVPGRGLKVAAGGVTVGATDMLSLSEDERRALMGARIALVPQAVGLSLTPHLDIAAHFRDVLSSEGGRWFEYGDHRVPAALDEVGLDGARMAHRYPHELSGGEQQRALIALALARDPEILLLDEPTSALDVGIAHDILELLSQQQAQRGFTMAIVSHDLAMVRRVAEHVVVMCDGEVVEQGPTAEVVTDPRHPYTRRLLAAAPSLGRRHAARASTSREEATLLDLQRVSVTRLRAGRRGPGTPTAALEGVSLQVRRGEILGVIGESGSGKSTLLRTVCGLLRPTAGALLLDGTDDLATPLRRRPRSVLRRVQMVFQNPDDSLNPAHSVRRILAAGHRADDDALTELLRTVGLDAGILDRRPGQLSGGEKQRVAIARALAQEPEVLLLDEVTSALDVTVQAEVLATLLGIHERLGTTMVFVSHDIAVVASIADRIAVLRNGKLLEVDDVETVLERASDPYTQRLVELARGG